MKKVVFQKNSKKNKIIIISIIALTSIAAIIYFGIKILNSNSNKVYSKYVNITNLSEDFMNTYLENVKELNDIDNKDNIVIITTEKNSFDTFGATKVVNAPNNQYFLQYETETQKNEALAKLKKDNLIASVVENTVHTVEEDTSSSDYNSWGVEITGLDYAMNNEAGTNEVVVAVIDTGLNVDLFNKYYNGRIKETYNVLENSTTKMEDAYGHGTHVTGIIAESTPNNVKILPIKVTAQVLMHTTDIITAINYVTYNKKANVINMSYGSPNYNEAEEIAIAAASKVNIICVAAAGNDNSSESHYPSDYDDTISVSSVDINLQKSTFSNYGSKIIVAAPGTNIKSITSSDTIVSRNNRNKRNDDGDDDHEIMSGTSMAAPHVSSAIAIFKTKNIDLSLNDAKELLKKNTLDLGEEGWDQLYGYGLLCFNCDRIKENRYGDVNQDGVISDDDVTLLTNYISGKAELTKYGKKSADVNNDGYINNIDSILLSGYLIELYPNTLPTIPITEYMIYGDVNQDGIISGIDTLLLLRYISGKEELSKQSKKNADVNNDGLINNTDANLLGGYLTNLYPNTLPTSPIKEYIMYGDINQDGIISSADTVLLLRYISGKEELSKQSKKNADINNDGLINNTDANLLGEYLVDLHPNTLPIKPIIE